jgi:beta-glucanase (GH16 family)
MAAMIAGAEPPQEKQFGKEKAAREGWKLVWADEFDYTGVPDPAKWDYEVGFHVYTMEWNSERMDFFCDQTKYFTFNLSKADDKGTNPYRKPQYLLLNLALGGGYGGPIDDSNLPQKFVIDYVRVYQRAEAKN